MRYISSVDYHFRLPIIWLVNYHFRNYEVINDFPNVTPLCLSETLFRLFKLLRIQYTVKVYHGSFHKEPLQKFHTSAILPFLYSKRFVLCGYIRKSILETHLLYTFLLSKVRYLKWRTMFHGLVTSFFQN